MGPAPTHVCVGLRCPRLLDSGPIEAPGGSAARHGPSTVTGFVGGDWTCNQSTVQRCMHSTWVCARHAHASFTHISRQYMPHCGAMVLMDEILIHMSSGAVGSSRSNRLQRVARKTAIQLRSIGSWPPRRIATSPNYAASLRFCTATVTVLQIQYNTLNYDLNVERALRSKLCLN